MGTVRQLMGRISRDFLGTAADTASGSLCEIERECPRYAKVVDRVIADLQETYGLRDRVRKPILNFLRRARSEIDKVQGACQTNQCGVCELGVIVGRLTYVEVMLRNAQDALVTEDARLWRDAARLLGRILRQIQSSLVTARDSAEEAYRQVRPSPASSPRVSSSSYLKGRLEIPFTLGARRA